MPTTELECHMQPSIHVTNVLHEYLVHRKSECDDLMAALAVSLYEQRAMRHQKCHISFILAPNVHHPTVSRTSEYARVIGMFVDVSITSNRPSKALTLDRFRHEL